MSLRCDSLAMLLTVKKKMKIRQLTEVHFMMGLTFFKCNNSLKQTERTMWNEQYYKVVRWITIKLSLLLHRDCARSAFYL